MSIHGTKCHTNNVQIENTYRKRERVNKRRWDRYNLNWNCPQPSGYASRPHRQFTILCTYENSASISHENLRSIEMARVIILQMLDWYFYSLLCCCCFIGGTPFVCLTLLEAWTPRDITNDIGSATKEQIVSCFM